MVHVFYEADVTLPNGEVLKLNMQTSGFPKSLDIARAELLKIHPKATKIDIRPIDGPVNMQGHPLATSLYNAAGQKVAEDHSIATVAPAPAPAAPAAPSR